MLQKSVKPDIPANTDTAKATILTDINYSNRILHRAGQFHKTYKNHDLMTFHQTQRGKYPSSHTSIAPFLINTTNNKHQ
jgi:hypothetical protein